MSTIEQDLETGKDLVAEQLAVAELEVLTSYTLADAIREGSSVTGQKIAGWTDHDDEGNLTACALSAGLMAARARGYA